MCRLSWRGSAPPQHGAQRHDSEQEHADVDALPQPDPRCRQIRLQAWSFQERQPAEHEQHHNRGDRVQPESLPEGRSPKSDRVRRNASVTVGRRRTSKIHRDRVRRYEDRLRNYESTGSGRRFSSVVAMQVAATMTPSKDHLRYPRPCRCDRLNSNENCRKSGTWCDRSAENSALLRTLSRREPSTDPDAISVYAERT